MKANVFVKYKKKDTGKSRVFRRWLETIILLLLGFSLGLAIAWEADPNVNLDPSPASLRSDYKDEYRFLIASAFSNTGDLGRAQVRLSLLGDRDPVQALIEQTQREFATGTSQHRIYALSVLTEAIQHSSIPSLSPTETPTSTMVAPTATSLPFTLLSQQVICDPASTQGLTQIQIQDTNGLPMAGVEVRVSWEKGQQHFYSGLKPESGNGYADFVMNPGTTYNLKVIPSSNAIKGLIIPECFAEDGSSFGGGYLLIFRQP